MCAVCGERIGVYEPVLVFVDQHARETSLAAEPALSAQPARLVHRDCQPSLPIRS